VKDARIRSESIPPTYEQREKAIQGTRNWNALFQGHPTTEEGAIMRSSYWRKWPDKLAPVCDYIIQSVDGAFEEHEEAHYSARTTGASLIFAKKMPQYCKDCFRSESGMNCSAIT
jgi:hypothetical protein